MQFVPKSWVRFAVSALVLGVAGASSAQYPQLRTSLLANIGIATFGVTGGNDCWGYVSPSGREYAIVGLKEAVAFVEVTNPTSPVWFASIPHTSSTWGDIKVYGHWAYAVTEAVGTGIQVIDMSQIDNHVITLTQTIMSPGRTHNLAMDDVNGFLYTCGSRNGTGTTMCFSLANPGNPVQVGAASMTLDYQHDGTIRTFTSGPYAGKQIWYGFSEGRGVDIYDFTNKALPIKIKTITYPGTEYCHQGWLSADAKYLYVDDELDEGAPPLQPTTRTLIFNVENLQDAAYVGSFTSGVAAIDHNQYWSDGFIFQANYRSGLRIFDAANPTAPVQVGYFDTYPANNLAEFSGAWSNYPFFPSGNVVVSDINRGFFLINVLDATTRTVETAEIIVPNGKNETSGLPEVLDSDDNRMVVHSSQISKGHDPISVVFATTSYDNSPLKIRLAVETRALDRGVEQMLELKNWDTGLWERVDRRVIGTSDTAWLFEAPGNAGRFSHDVTRRVEARLSWGYRTERTNPVGVEIDHFEFRITR